MAEESQISAIPPERYGDRFIKFISSVTKTKEAAEREKADESAHVLNDPMLSGVNTTRGERESTDNVLHKAQAEADHTKRHGASEKEVPKREIRAVRSPSAERGELGTTLPIVEEAQETSSTDGRSAKSTNTDLPATAMPPLREVDRALHDGSRERNHSHGRPPPTPPKDSGTGASEGRPPTPPKDSGYAHSQRTSGYSQRNSGPPTPPKEDRDRSRASIETRASLDKELPHLPPMDRIGVAS